MKQTSFIKTCNCRGKKGFTLAELLIVIAIIAILAAIAIPTYNNAVEKSRQARDLANIRQVYSSFRIAALHPDTEISKGTIYYAADGTLVSIGKTLTQRFAETYGENGRTNGPSAAGFKVQPLVSKKFRDAAATSVSADKRLGFNFTYGSGAASAAAGGHYSDIVVKYQGPDLGAGLTD